MWVNLNTPEMDTKWYREEVNTENLPTCHLPFVPRTMRVQPHLLLRFIASIVQNP